MDGPGGQDVFEGGRPQVEVVVPTEQDLPRVLELLHAQDEFHHSIDPTYYVEPGNAKRVDAFKEDLNKTILGEDKNKHVRIAKVGGQIVGFVTYEDTQASYPDTNIENYVEVKELYVDQTQRNLGTGRKLAQVAIDHADKGDKHMVAQYSALNTGASNFWTKMGFPPAQIIGIRPPQPPTPAV